MQRIRALVTGVAGFIGSHLAETLLADGCTVTGVDAFVPYYPRWIKDRNLERLRAYPGFTLVEADLVDLDLPALVAGADWCFHLAAQAGVRASWGEDFAGYTRHNILATQRLLEAARTAPHLQRLVVASSSSVYGRQSHLPVSEDAPLQPVSPYGLTKLATEHLCRIYADQFGVPAVMLRYFTVYGPGQRPDMAFHRFIRAALAGEPITIYGDGRQTRDFTYVTDVVAATVAAARQGRAGAAYNICGGTRVALGAVVDYLENLVGPIERAYHAAQTGDVTDTWGSLDRAQADLGFAPRVQWRDGLARQVAWVRQLYGLGDA